MASSFRCGKLLLRRRPVGVCLAISLCGLLLLSYEGRCPRLSAEFRFPVRYFENGYRLSMLTELADVKKEGWDEDYLPTACRRKTYNNLDDWPKASVIITFCSNERLTDVLHTVHSVIQRSPNVLIKEVILVDDNSQKEEFGEVFVLYCSAVFGGQVKVVRSNTSLGLIKARLLGSRMATGDVIVSMDAHVEVQDTWLEALLWEIKKNRRTLATPALDWMFYKPGDGWTYRSGFSSFICIFGWDLNFGLGFSRPEIETSWKKDNTMALPAPCTVGTAWAIDRRFFIEIGELDDGMEKWGGENLDLAVRTWLFGGRAVQVPCSHVGHLERPNQRDYRMGWEEYTNRNYKRIVDVWFDDYKKYVFQERPGLEVVDPGDITERLHVKKRAHHNFTWFLDNVFPELGIYDRNTVAYGSLQNLGQKRCLQRSGSNPLSLWQCEDANKEQRLFLTNDGYLRTDLQTWHAAGKVIGSHIGPEGATGTYHENWLSQWIHWKNGPMLLYEADGRGTKRSLCMEGFPNGTVSLQRCDTETNRNQLWQWGVYSPLYDVVLGRSLARIKYDQELLTHHRANAASKWITGLPKRH